MTRFSRRVILLAAAIISPWSALAQGVISQEIMQQCAFLSDPDEGIACWSRHINQTPTHATLYVARANVYRKKGDSDKALSDFSEAIRLEPRHAVAFNLRGEHYARLGRKDLAARDFEAALAINPNFAAGRSNLEKLAAQKQDGGSTGSPETKSAAKQVTKQAEPRGGPSFDCAKANSPAAKLICGSAELSQWDRELGLLYRRLLQSRAEDQRRAFQDEQVAWIRKRNAKCFGASTQVEEQTSINATQCMGQWIAERTIELKKLSESANVDSGEKPGKSAGGREAILKPGTYIKAGVPCEEDISVNRMIVAGKNIVARAYCLALAVDVGGAVRGKPCKAGDEEPTENVATEQIVSIKGGEAFDIPEIGAYRYCAPLEGVAAAAPPKRVAGPPPQISYPKAVMEQAQPFVFQRARALAPEIVRVINEQGPVRSRLNSQTTCNVTNTAHTWYQNGYDDVHTHVVGRCDNGADINGRYSLSIDRLRAVSFNNNPADPACRLVCTAQACVEMTGSLGSGLSTELTLFGTKSEDICKAFWRLEETRQSLYARMQDILRERFASYSCPTRTSSGLSEDELKAINYLLDQRGEFREAKACIVNVALNDKIKFTGFTLAKVSLSVTYPAGYLTDCFTEMPLQGSACKNASGLQVPARPNETRRFNDEIRF